MIDPMAPTIEESKMTVLLIQVKLRRDTTPNGTYFEWVEKVKQMGIIPPRPGKYMTIFIEFGAVKDFNEPSLLDFHFEDSPQEPEIHGCHIVVHRLFPKHIIEEENRDEIQSLFETLLTGLVDPSTCPDIEDPAEPARIRDMFECQPYMDFDDMDVDT